MLNTSLPALLELQAKDQWVCWCYEHNAKSKLTKIPYNARTGNKASTTNSATWSDFQTAYAAWQLSQETDESYDGLGFVLNDDYTVIDLDHCIVKETGKPNEWAQAIIDRINSYTEISPSGTGIHIIAKGKIPAGIKRPNIEMYSRGRYITISGNLLEGGQHE